MSTESDARNVLTLSLSRDPVAITEASVVPTAHGVFVVDITLVPNSVLQSPSWGMFTPHPATNIRVSFTSASNEPVAVTIGPLPAPPSWPSSGQQPTSRSQPEVSLPLSSRPSAPGPSSGVLEVYSETEPESDPDDLGDFPAPIVNKRIQDKGDVKSEAASSKRPRF